MTPLTFKGVLMILTNQRGDDIFSLILGHGPWIWCYQCQSCVGGGRHIANFIRSRTIYTTTRGSASILKLFSSSASRDASRKSGDLTERLERECIWKGFYLWDYPVRMRGSIRKALASNMVELMLRGFGIQAVAPQSLSFTFFL